MIAFASETALLRASATATSESRRSSRSGRWPHSCFGAGRSSGPPPGALAQCHEGDRQSPAGPGQVQRRRGIARAPFRSESGRAGRAAPSARAHRITRVILCPYGPNRASRQACCGTSSPRYRFRRREGNWDRVYASAFDGMTLPRTRRRDGDHRIDHRLIANLGFGPDKTHIQPAGVNDNVTGIYSKEP